MLQIIKIIYKSHKMNGLKIMIWWGWYINIKYTEYLINWDDHVGYHLMERWHFHSRLDGLTLYSLFWVRPPSHLVFCLTSPSQIFSSHIHAIRRNSMNSLRAGTPPISQFLITFSWGNHRGSWMKLYFLCALVSDHLFLFSPDVV